MDGLIEKKGFNSDFFKELIYISKNELKEISDMGHEIGLHSHTHPTNLAALSKENQLVEYQTNSNKLHAITGRYADVMAHPSNSYSKDTLQILNEMGVKFGFCSNDKVISTNKYELDRWIINSLN
ncbi:MAG: polysaccharide deacetylase family protein [Sphingobacteriaceae bacterium]|nr:polysaccharide deacetylase family protein [Sphingobacteriaceae bacterium]